MKNLMITLFCAVISLTVFGANSFEFVNSQNGYSYIQINENLEAFSFKSDFKSIGNSGKVGYVVYTSDLSEEQLENYLKSNSGNAEFGKKINKGVVNLGSLKAGDRVGFYLERNNGSTIYETLFVTKHGTDYLEFSKNGVGSSKDEWMSIEDVKTTPVSGAPLPGIPAVLVTGVIGALSLRKKKRS